MKNSRFNWTRTLLGQKPQIKNMTNLVRKYLETTVFLKRGQNILRSAEVMNSLVFSDVCDRFIMIKSLFTALYC